MKAIATALIFLMSVSAFSMDLEEFVDNCPQQIEKISEIDSLLESRPPSEINFAQASVIMSAIRGFILDTERCEDIDYDIREVLLVMENLNIRS